jgi:RNA polymerase sigma-70 factor, ECF subfamily
MPATTDQDADLVAALRAGDETAFATLVDRHSPSMLRVARGYVHSHESAEEVVQDTWMALVKGIAGFEGRSSLRTWLFTVLINIAKSRGIREHRTTDFEMLAYGGHAMDPARFNAPGEEWPGHWKPDQEPLPFPDTPEGSVLGDELVALTRRELDKQPERQRTVVTLRDILGFEAAEVADLLEISAANQRVLLHRGRAAIRQVLEDYLKEGSS